MRSCEGRTAYTGASGDVHVLPDAFTIEDVVALGLDSVFGYVVAETTDGRLDDFTGERSVRPTLEDQVGLSRVSIKR